MYVCLSGYRCMVATHITGIRIPPRTQKKISRWRINGGAPVFQTGIESVRFRLSAQKYLISECSSIGRAWFCQNQGSWVVANHSLFRCSLTNVKIIFKNFIAVFSLKYFWEDVSIITNSIFLSRHAWNLRLSLFCIWFNLSWPYIGS